MHISAHCFEFVFLVKFFAYCKLKNLIVLFSVIKFVFQFFNAHYNSKVVYLSVEKINHAWLVNSVAFIFPVVLGFEL